jgi:hypothetical protein
MAPDGNASPCPSHCLPRDFGRNSGERARSSHQRRGSRGFRSGTPSMPHIRSGPNAGTVVATSSSRVRARHVGSDEPLAVVSRWRFSGGSQRARPLESANGTTLLPGASCWSRSSLMSSMKRCCRVECCRSATHCSSASASRVPFGPARRRYTSRTTRPTSLRDSND